MGHLGFSYMGLFYLLLLFLPNLVWSRNKPEHYESQSENRVLAALERMGQVCVTCCAVMFSDFNLRPWSVWSLWLAGSLLLMALYEVWWVRYFRSGKTLPDFYSGLLGIPVAGATLPVLAFLLLGIYGKVIWMVLSTAILGVGHIGIHLQHRRQWKELRGVFMTILWTRDSVCMGDDVTAPNARTEEIDGSLTISDLLDKAADYVPCVSGAVWAVWAEDVLAGYLEMSVSGYLLRDEAVLEELPPPKPDSSFLTRKSAVLHVRCVLHTMSDFWCRKGVDGLPLAEHFPPYTPLLDMVKAKNV